MMRTQTGAGEHAGGSEETFREYRALLVESEPWKEEVFMLEIVAALQVTLSFVSGVLLCVIGYGSHQGHAR